MIGAFNSTQSRAATADTLEKCYPEDDRGLPIQDETRQLRENSFLKRRVFVGVIRRHALAGSSLKPAADEGSADSCNTRTRMCRNGAVLKRRGRLKYCGVAWAYSQA